MLTIGLKKKDHKLILDDKLAREIAKLYKLTFTGTAGNSNVLRSTFNVQRSTFNVQRLTIAGTVNGAQQPSAFKVYGLSIQGLEH